MKIFTALSYYRPYTSGLTIYAARLARELVRRGHQVTVLTAQHDPALPLEETLQGVQVRRVPVWKWVGKGPLMPDWLKLARPLLQSADLVHLHLPQLDAAPLALQAKTQGLTTLVTYHCDLHLPPEAALLPALRNRMAALASQAASTLAVTAADWIVQNSLDYASYSPLLKRYLYKVSGIFPPIEVSPLAPEALDRFKQRIGYQPGEVLIGMAARLAAEKGVEHLAAALPLVLEKYPQARVLFVGPYQNVPGEAEIARRVLPQIARLGDRWQFLGVLPDDEFTAFMRLCSVTALPSANPTESFGMVQVEAMLNGTPVVAANLPGVRVPVQMTGIGCLFAPGDVQALAQALIAVLDDPQSVQPREESQPFLQACTTSRAADQYELLMERLLKRAK